MSDALLIPMTLEVLLVNGALRGRDTFRTWRHTYTALRDFGSPEPLPFDCNYEDTRVGAFLHWTLPRALRAGAPGSSTDFPLVPNRWLINRVGRPTEGPNPGKAELKSWVLESDHIHNDATASSYYLVASEVLDDWNSKATAPDQADPKAPANAKMKVVPYGLALPSKPWQEKDTSTEKDTNKPVPPGEASSDAYPVNLGKAFDLADWVEPALAKQTKLFLTAIAPGNLEFSGYVPFNEGVFSFFDELAGIDKATVSYQVTGWYSDPAQDIVPPLPAKAEPAEALNALTDSLAALNWDLPAGSTPELTPEGKLERSLYTGTAYGLPWDRNATVVVPAEDELETTQHQQNLNVALGNNGVDAFSTLVAAQLAADGQAPNASHTAELLRAFHYDLLPLLDKPNGHELLGERIRQEWFSARAGGTQWAIVSRQPEKPPGHDGADKAIEVVLTPAEADRLWQLNQDQRAVDECVATLTSLQWDLHAAWWKNGYRAAAPVGGAATAAPKATEPAPVEGLVPLLDQVARQLEKLHELLKQVPNASPNGKGTSQQYFLDAVEAFAKWAFNDGAGLAPDKVLKAVAQPRYWLPGNPSVVLSQVQPSDITSPDNQLAVRLTQHLVRALTEKDKQLTLPALGTEPAVSPPLPRLPGGVPPGVVGLHEEFCLLDPTNRAYLVAKPADPLPPKSALAAALPGVLPDPGTLPVCWRQQWHPMYLEWEALYTDVPFVNPVTGNSNWRFNGTDYELAAEVHSAGAPQVLHGRSLLSPSAQLTFRGRLQKFVAHFGDKNPALQDLNDEIAAIDDWKFLSQDLVGLNDLLAQRDIRAFRLPADEQVEITAPNGKKVKVALQQLMGYSVVAAADAAAPYNTPAQAQGLLHAVPAIAPTRHGASAFPFHALRSGQLYLSHLVLYDKFGRQLDLVMPEAAGMLDADVFPLIRDAALLPTFNLTPAIAKPVQLPPRLLQPARLDLRLVDHRTRKQPEVTQPKTKTEVAVTPSEAANQASAEAMNPVGGWVLVNHLDEALLLYAPDGSSQGELLTNHEGRVVWNAPPHTPAMPGIDAARYPRLAAFAKGIEGMSEAQFETLLDVVDSTLWTVDPLGNRADQHLSVLVGRPLALVAVHLQLSLYGPAMTGHDWTTDPDPGPAPRFSVRLGNQASREDGVIGYFANGYVGQYDVFNSVVAPDYDNQPNLPEKYVQQIGPLGPPPDGKAANYLALAVGEPPLDLTLLVDPRATIHATTGLLPVKTLTLPRQFVDQPLANLEMSFRVGPLLSRIKLVEKAPAPKGADAAAPPTSTPTPTPTPEIDAADHAGVGPRAADLFPALSYLPVSEKNGTWAWLKKQPPVPIKAASPEAAATEAAAPPLPPVEYPLVPAATQASFAIGPASLHEGFLLFRGGEKPAVAADTPGPKAP